MELAEALEIVVGRTKHDKYRRFVDPTDELYHPAWEAEIVRLANNLPDMPAPAKAPTPYPSLARQAVNAIGAAVAFVTGGCQVVDDTEAERRLDICRSCEHFDPEPVRCRQCGCGMDLKTRLQSSVCPVGKW